MWGVPPSLKGFAAGDDEQDTDTFNLVALGVVPNTTTDMLWENQGTVGPITPVGFLERIQSMWLVNRTNSTGTVTVYKLNTQASTSSFVPVAEYQLGAGGSFQVSSDQFRVVAPPNCKFQVLTTVTADVIASTRYLKGAGQ